MPDLFTPLLRDSELWQLTRRWSGVHRAPSCHTQGTPRWASSRSSGCRAWHQSTASGSMSGPDTGSSAASSLAASARTHAHAPGTRTQRCRKCGMEKSQTCQNPPGKAPEGAQQFKLKVQRRASARAACKDWLKFTDGFFTGQSSDTRRLVVAISLSGSAVNFSLTVDETKHTTWNNYKLKGWISFYKYAHFLIYLSIVKATNITSNCSIKTDTCKISWVL